MPEEIEGENKVANIIREWNKNGGEEPAAPVVQTQEPVQTTPEPKVTTPAAIKPPTLPTEKVIPPDPKFVRSDKTDANPATETPAATEQTPVVAPPVVAPVPDEQVYTRLNELTEGSIRSEDDLIGFINHYNELLQQAEEGFQPKFANDQAKLAYDLLMKAGSGKELEAAERTIRALKFPVDKADDRDILFEAYRQKPVNSDLSDAEAIKYFNAEYEQKYTDLDNNLVQKRAHAVEVKEARESISKLKSDFTAAQAQPAEAKQRNLEVEQSIAQVVDNFGGVKLSFSDNPSEEDYLTLPVTDQKELAALKDSILNPGDWYQNFLDSFNTPKGYDYEGLARAKYEMNNGPAIRRAAFEHGKKLGALAQINKDRNATPKELAQLGGNNGAPAPAAKKSFMETWEDAKHKKSA